MLKKYVTTIIAVICIVASIQTIAQTRSAPAPDNVIMLVDVSKSVLNRVSNPNEIALGVLNPLLSGNGLNENVSFTGRGSLPKIWIDSGQKLLVLPFGDLNTDTQFSSSVRAEQYEHAKTTFFSDALNSKWPEIGRYKDDFSYRRLAVARAADLAKKNGFRSYWLLMVGDNIDSEQKGVTAFSADQQLVIENYTKSLQEDSDIGTIRLAGSRNDYGVLVKHILLDSTDVKKSGAVSTVIIDPPTQCQDIVINFLKTSTKDNRLEFESGKGNLQWECNCDTISLFMVNVKGVDGAEVSAGLKELATSNPILPLKSLNAGKYNVTIHAGGVSSTAYITIKGFDSTLIMVAVLIAVLLALLYFFRDRLKTLFSGNKKNKQSHKPKENNNDTDWDSDDY